VVVVVLDKVSSAANAKLVVLIHDDHYRPAVPLTCIHRPAL